MTLSQLSYIVAIEQHGSFIAAAKSLNVSQPALSEMVSKLESELGVIIFDRKRGAIQPTPIGIQVLNQARQTLVQAELIKEAASVFTNEIQGELRIGMIPTLAPSIIRLFLKSFRVDHPAVRLEIFEAGTDILVEKVGNGELDLAILATPENTPANFIVKPLFYESFVVYAAKGNELLKMKNITRRDLENQSLILMDGTHCTREQIESICDLSKRKSLKRTTVHGGISTLISVVDEESGFTLIPELLKNQVDLKQIRPFEDSKYRRKVSILLNKTYLKRKLVDLLAEKIQKNLPEGIAQEKSKFMKVTDPLNDRFE